VQKHTKHTKHEHDWFKQGRETHSHRSQTQSSYQHLPQTQRTLITFTASICAQIQRVYVCVLKFYETNHGARRGHGGACVQGFKMVREWRVSCPRLDQTVHIEKTFIFCRFRRSQFYCSVAGSESSVHTGEAKSACAIRPCDLNKKKRQQHCLLVWQKDKPVTCVCLCTIVKFCNSTHS
jgi:hypothetical protein